MSKHDFVYVNGLLTADLTNTNKLIFSYDDQGHPATLKHNNNVYYYVINQQGDVLALRDASNNVVASYSYNAWGELLSSSGTMANTNPLRYRGYYYDTETGFYYLQSRYYDPVICRFINADGYVSTGQDFLGFNMFAYCGNNPVNMADRNGRSAEVAVAGWGASMWWLTLLDGPLPIADLIYCGVLVLLGGLALKSANDDPSPNSTSGEKETPKPETPQVEYPGDDPTKAPEGTEWRGKGEPGSKEGNYYNPNTGESWHQDLDHPEPIGPHWDYNYKGSGGRGWRVFPDGRIISKMIDMIY